MASLLSSYGNVFRVIGQKEIHLPPIQAVVTLLRTKDLPPTFARFRVPLNWNKLDLKDYLYHAYGVEALHVTSSVKLSPILENKPSDTMKRGRKWYRPISKKFMTIRMDKAFVWPDEPEDFSPWDKKAFMAQRDARERQREAQKASRQ
jgi:large subunit ribosomal protein L23